METRLQLSAVPVGEGPSGSSAYEIAVYNGFSGTEAEWLASLVGEDGQAGPQGPAGPQGLTGPQGPPGPAGADAVLDDSGWVDAVYSAQYQQYDGFPHLSTRKIGNIVYARGLARSVSTNVPSNHILGYIGTPDHYPSGNLVGVALGSGTVFFRADVKSTGQIYWLNPATTFSSTGAAWFGFDQWFWFTD